jgi:PAS domain S-box-containing protein
MKKKIKCWEFFGCDEEECPVFRSNGYAELCWLMPGTHCRNEIQGKFLEKIEMCLACHVFKANVDLDSMEETLAVVNEQFIEFRRMVEERDKELEDTSMELAVGLSEVFEALREISSGDPEVRIPETSRLQLIAKLKHMVNLSAENLGKIVYLSHEFAIGLAEHFDVLHRVSKGDLTARVSGVSQVELLESLKKVTNYMIESVSKEIAERERVARTLKASEARLRESEEKYHSLFDYDPNSIFVLESETFKILDANARCLEVYGYEKEELIGKSFMDIGPAEYSDGILSKTAPLPSTLCSVYPQAQHRRKDGTRFYVNVYCCQRRRTKKYGIIATTVDITESLAKEAQLIQASKMSTLGEMATGVAHELNQPLSTIQIGTDVLRNMIKEGEKIPDSELALVSEQMAEQVARAVRIINHLRQFGRKAQIQPEKVDINKPLEGVFTLLSQQLKLRGIRVVLDLTEDLPPIMGDSNRLEQVFVDLVINARDAMEEKKKQLADSDLSNTLTVRSFKENSQVVVTITDTGTGIPDEIREKIFEPFFTTKRVGEGTGLGLSISYGIVQDYNGTIEVESEVGKGSTFKTSFPAYEEEEHELQGYV